MPLNWPTSQLRDLADVRVSNVDKKSYAAERPIRLCNYMDVYANDPDSGSRIINWPEQTYNNGVERNTATGRKYKRVIRILKRLRDRMQDDGIAIAKKTPSFLIECLVWNADVDFGF